MIPSNTEKFLRGVKRRIALIRLLESVGFSCLLASGLGVVLITALWWRGESGFAAAWGMLGLGVLGGLIWGLRRLPTTFEAASEADRQLGLHDLLGTILLTRGTDEAWLRAVAATAEERCGRLRPGDVLVAKLGVRAWSGIGLSAALLMTLSLLSTRPADARAGEASSIDTGDGLAMADSSVAADALRLAPFQNSRPRGSGTDADSDRSFENDQPIDGATRATGNANRNGSNGAGNAGSGEGLAVTKGSFAGHIPTVGMGGDDGISAGLDGAGGGSGTARGVGKAPGGTSSTNLAAKRAPNWRADGQAQSSGAYPSANQNVPNWAADLVRAYFQRD
jgi:hypothetical protein